MNYLYAKFGNFSFSSFGSIVRTDRQNHTQRRRGSQRQIVSTRSKVIDNGGHDAAHELDDEAFQMKPSGKAIDLIDQIVQQYVKWCGCCSFASVDKSLHVCR